MRLDQAINQFVASTIAALQMTGSVAGARVRVDGGQAQAYAAGWDDALVSLARAPGVDLQLDEQQSIGHLPPAPLAQIAPR